MQVLLGRLVIGQSTGYTHQLDFSILHHSLTLSQTKMEICVTIILEETAQKEDWTGKSEPGRIIACVTGLKKIRYM